MQCVFKATLQGLILQYCADNLLDLNSSKCSIVTYSRKRELVLFDYKLKGTRLKRDSVVRDLGVYHDSKLLFNVHIDNVISKASRALGFVMRSSVDFHHIKTLKILYCSFVRSHLEYASQIWNPRYQTYTRRIENIQKRFLKFLCFRARENYNSDQYLDLCRKHHLLPLDKRREIANILFLLKIVSGSIDCPELVSKICLRIPSKTLRFGSVLWVPPASTNFRQNAYLWRACNNLNMLLKDINLDIFHSSEASARRIMSGVFFND
jgi:hypothetical protein